MDRRIAIKNTASLIGAGFLTPALLAALQSCQSSNTDIDWTAQVLTQDQVKVLTALSDTILPETESLSASQAKVGQFIDLILQDVLTESQKDQVINGLNELESHCQEVSKKSIVRLDEDQRTEFIRQIDDAAYAHQGKIKEDLLKNYRYIKSLILMAYFTSEQGVKQNLHYVSIPGEYQACFDLPSDQKIVVGDHL